MPRRGPITEADYRVEDRGYETPCWIWTGPRSTQGYARFGRDGLAHAMVDAEANGPMPASVVVHHRCEQKLCIHLDHRRYSPEVVEAVRRATGSTRQIALRYGVSKSHVALLRMDSYDPTE